MNRKRLLALLLKTRLPVVYDFRESAEEGGLMSYGLHMPDLSRRAAAYVHKILRGARPANLPVERPTKFHLAINMKAAKVVGITIPPTLLLRADQVIE